MNSSSTANLVQLEKVSLRYGAGDRSTLAIDGSATGAATASLTRSPNLPDH